jgi:phenylpyruvate tautomerase PptA (4-oxalocrotonate tautomerase family)
VAQVKIYGLRRRLDPVKARLSAIIHDCAVEVLGLPAEKRFHRFFPLADDDFVFPADRSDRYTIVEISLFEGRTVAAKKELVRLLFARLEAEVGIAPQDVEITLFETPRHNWGIRGAPGDELALSYRVEA